MAPTLWAPYGDALKLILTGSATGKLSPAQRDVFTTMLSQGQRDDNGKSGEKRHLPRINTAEYCIDEGNNEFETYYYIPDVVRLMIEVHGRRSLLTLPFDQNYLNSDYRNLGSVCHYLESDQHYLGSGRQLLVFPCITGKK